jgi:ornithine cyclodeaminase
MLDGDILILRGHEVEELLAGKELELMQTARAAYEAHAAGASSLPHSTFLRFPDNASDRVIGLPAYLGDDFEVAGIKWISSFPGNLERGLDRASAVMILNATDTGRPRAIIEASIISAKRTAASAALAAQYLHPQKSESIAVIGCGLINFEVTRFLLASRPEVRRLVIADLYPAQAESFRNSCRDTFGEIEVEIGDSIESVLASSTLVSIATTATKPHIFNLDACAPASTLLHVSLRDLSPEAILASDNIVDDIDHVCRAETSVHLAEQLTGGREFIRCTLADITRGTAAARAGEGSIAVFSPFGLGVLDLAVGKLVYELGVAQKQGVLIQSFLPKSWTEKKRAAEASR